ncbi:hypothetical protein EJB05_09859, partial [Eragrostis curvula]
MVLVMLFSLSTLFIVEGTCDGAPIMTWTDACLKACTTPTLYNLCQQTLQIAPNTAQVTVYAFVAAKLAVTSYQTTTAAAKKLMADASVPADDRAAYKYCVDQYAVATERMDGVVDDMYNCKFNGTIREYVDSDSAVLKCTDALSTLKNSPLVKMNAADHDAAAVAQGLGSLIVGRVAKVIG